MAGHHDQLEIMKFKMRQNLEELIGFTAVGKREYDIVLHDHTEIAVHTVPGMNKKRRGAGTGQGGRDLPAYQSRFAYSGHNHLAATTAQQFDRSNETFVETIDH